MKAQSSEVSASDSRFAPGAIRLGFIGDVMFGELLENFRRGVRTKVERDGIDPFEFVRTELCRNHINVANLECVLANTSNRKGLFREILRAPSEFVELLHRASIRVVSVANNHALDHGREALAECVGHLSDAGIEVVGFETGNLRQANASILQVCGFRLAFWGFNLANLTPDEFSLRSKRILEKVTASAVESARVIVLMHWGEEYTSVPPPEIVRLGRELASAGACIICGHHSHRLQGVTQLGNAVFAPSLGNFIFDDRRKDSSLTSILRVTIENSGIPKWDSGPCTINQDFQPVPDPARIGELNELNDKLHALMDEEDSGATPIRERIARDVARGHRHNRIRMRLLMVRHFIMYRGMYNDILSHILGKNRVPFSVSDSSEWNSGTE